MHALLGEPTGQGWIQLFELATALVLSTGPNDETDPEVE